MGLSGSMFNRYRTGPYDLYATTGGGGASGPDNWRSFIRERKVEFDCLSLCAEELGLDADELLQQHRYSENREIIIKRK